MSFIGRHPNSYGYKDFENMKGIKYECVRCGHKFDGEELDFRNAVKCPNCGYRVIQKIRPPVIKRLSTD